MESFVEAMPFQTKEFKLILDELGDDCKGKFTSGCDVQSCMLLSASTDNPTEVDHITALKCLASWLGERNRRKMIVTLLF